MIEIILLTIILVFVWLMAIYFWWQFSLLKKRIEREAREAKEAIDKAFQKLRENIEREIEFLDKEPGLSEEEKKLRDRLEEILSFAKELMEKEIEDIKKTTE